MTKPNQSHGFGKETGREIEGRGREKRDWSIDLVFPLLPMDSEMMSTFVWQALSLSFP